MPRGNTLATAETAKCHRRRRISHEGGRNVLADTMRQHTLHDENTQQGWGVLFSLTVVQYNSTWHDRGLLGFSESRIEGSLYRRLVAVPPSRAVYQMQ